MKRQDEVNKALDARLKAAMNRLVTDLPLEVALRALAAPTDLGALAQIVSEAGREDPAAALDPLAPAIARFEEHRHAILKKAGPLLTSSELGVRFGISRQAVDKRRQLGRLLALRAGGDWRYPEAQLDGGRVLPGFDEVLRALAPRDPYVMAEILLMPDDTLDGISLLEQLRRDGGLSETVTLVLRQLEGDGFA